MLRPEVVATMEAIHSYFLSCGEISIATWVVERAVAQQGHHRWAIDDAIAQFVQDGYLVKDSWLDGEIATSIFGGPAQVSGVHEVAGLQVTMEFLDWRPPVAEDEGLPEEEAEEPPALSGAEQKAYDTYQAAAKELGANPKYQDAWEWITKFGYDEYQPTFAAFEKALRRALKKCGEQKNTRRNKKTSGSAVGKDDAEASFTVPGSGHAAASDSSRIEECLSLVGGLFLANGEDREAKWNKLAELSEEVGIPAADITGFRDLDDLCGISDRLAERLRIAERSAG